MTRKILSVVTLLLASMLIFCSCSRDTSYIAELNGKKISASDYSLKMFTAFASAKEETGETSNDVDAILANKIDGIDAEQWIQNKALFMLRQQLAINAEFDRLKLALSDEDIASADAEVENQWENYSEVYIKNGVEKESLTAASYSNIKPKYIFEALYGKDGENALSTDELAEFLDADYQFLRLIGVSKRDEDGELFGKNKLEKQLEKANEYLNRINSGEDADALVAQAEEELCELTGMELEHEHGDVLQSHITSIKNGEAVYSVEMTELIEQLSRGETALFEDDENYYFVIQKLSSADNIELLESNRLAISYDLKLDEFYDYLDSLSDAVPLETNAAALNYYMPHLFVFD